MDNYIIIIILLLNIIFFSIGYILGKLCNNLSVNEPKSFLKTQNTIKNKYEQLNIDEKKIVVPIKTLDLEKKYTTLGEITTSSDSISDSVNKLKNLKR